MWNLVSNITLLAALLKLICIAKIFRRVSQNVQRDGTIGHFGIKFGMRIWRIQSLISFGQRLEFKNLESQNLQEKLFTLFCFLLFTFSKLQRYRGVFCKVGILKNFANFTGKHLCWVLLSIKLHAYSWKPLTVFAKNSILDVWLLFLRFSKEYYFLRKRNKVRTLLNKQSIRIRLRIRMSKLRIRKLHN